MDVRYDESVLSEAAGLVEKANADLSPELMSAADKQALLGAYARIRRLADFGLATLAQAVDDPQRVARTAGTSIGRARELAATGKVLHSSPELSGALQSCEVSYDQAVEIAKAEDALPGAADELVKTAKEQSFQVLRDTARRVKLAAEQHRDLGERQRKARRGSVYDDDLGMVNVHLRLEPHVGSPIANRAEAEARRLFKAAKKLGDPEPFECYLADAHAKLLSGSGKGSTTRPELVVLVSHEVVKRGWTDVRQGEHCKIPGVGPVPPEVAKEIAADAFLNGVFFDGTDLRHFKRWGKHRPKTIQIALDLGKPPDFDGARCEDCGNRHRLEFDHVEPRASNGATCTGNLEGRCDPCHDVKTEEDRKNGKLQPPEP